MTLERDARYMRQAVKLAARAAGRTSPNPMVGAVVVRGDQVVGQGYHRRVGTDHGEIAALKDAGRKARGAELFVNLEPCCHHGRTGPCAEALIGAGVERVVVGMKDPNPLVNGKGIRKLRRAGVEVVSGVLEPECRELNAAFICYITEQRPLVTFKSAVTLDGKVATRGGHSRWVTGKESRVASHRMRNTLDAIAVGVGTVLGDDPSLTCREVRRGRDPVRVVIDSLARTPTTARVINRSSSAPTLIFCTDRAKKRRVTMLERAGAEVVPVASEVGQVDVAAVLQELARREITTLLLEGGPRLAGAFWHKGLVDRVVAFVAPKVLGDPRGMSMVVGPGVEQMSDATELEDVKVRRMGADVMITGKVKRKGKGKGQRKGKGRGRGKGKGVD